MEVLNIIILFVSIFALGFISGRLWNLNKDLKELKELHDGLEEVKELSRQYEEKTNAYIARLNAENQQLKLELNYYKLGGNATNDILLTEEESK